MPSMYTPLGILSRIISTELVCCVCVVCFCLCKICWEHKINVYFNSHYARGEETIAWRAQSERPNNKRQWQRCLQHGNVLNVASKIATKSIKLRNYASNNFFFLFKDSVHVRAHHNQAVLDFLFSQCLDRVGEICVCK